MTKRKPKQKPFNQEKAKEQVLKRLEKKYGKGQVPKILNERKEKNIRQAIN